jgi:hypothetical protein
VCEKSTLTKDRQRSRITNGALLPDVVDGRSPWVRRCKDIIAAHLSDLGGVDATSEAERSIIRRAAVLTTSLEAFEVKFALVGEAAPADLDLYQRTAGNLRRLLEAVGLQRRAREILPDPLDYAREHLQSEAEANKEGEPLP